MLMPKYTQEQIDKDTKKLVEFMNRKKWLNEGEYQSCRSIMFRLIDALAAGQIKITATGKEIIPEMDAPYTHAGLIAKW